MAAKGWQKIKGEWKKMRPAKRRRTLSETPLDVKIARANTRIKAIEKAGLQDLSPAYRNIKALSKLSQKDNDGLYNVNGENVRFSGALKKLSKKDTDLVKRLESEVDRFLSSKTGTLRATKQRQAEIERGYKEYLKNLKETDRKLYDTLSKSRSKLNENRKLTGKRRMSFERYVRIFDGALVQKMFEYMPSDEAVEIMLDIDEALDEALNQLAVTGHKRLALINGPVEVRRFREFAEAYKEKTRRLGWADAAERIFTIPHFGDYVKSSQDAVEAVFNRPDPADAVLVASGQSKGIMLLIERMGLRIPEDVSVLHFIATDRESEKFVPRRSGIESPADLLASNAIDILQDLMKQGRCSTPQRHIPAVFRNRSSVRQI